jgi:hypothetical protein
MINFIGVNKMGCKAGFSDPRDCSYWKLRWPRSGCETCSNYTEDIGHIQAEHDFDFFTGNRR